MKTLQGCTLLVLLTLFLGLPLTAQADEDDLEWQGLISQRPSGTTVGTWVVGGVTFEATATTQIDETDGPLVNEGCAEVDYIVIGATNQATKIDSEPAYKCNGSDDDDDDGDDGDDGDDDDGSSLKIYAVINSFPAAPYIGTWTIGGVDYTADANTRFKQEDGSFAVGRCVEVEYVDSPKRAIEIETEDSYKCDGDGVPSDTSYQKMYGILDAFPADLVGTWTISGTTYTATATTEFEQEEGPFFVGRCVEVKYQNGTGQAVEISTEEAYQCSGSGDPVESKFYGIIQTVPADPQNGTWQIGGGSFISNASTELDEEDGALVAGTCAEVEFYEDPNGDRIATSIDSDEDYKCGDGSYTNKVYGRITTFPTGLYGTWVLDNGQSYESTAATQFEQDDGSFAIDVCVSLEYYLDGGVLKATKIETKDDCGGGGDLPGISKVYATVSNIDGTTWTIGGNEYQATDTTEIEGTPQIDDCVEAKYSSSGGVRTLLKVDVEDDYKCQVSADDSTEQFKAYGVVEMLPTGGLTGTWQISGVTYEADSSTEFDQEYGAFAIGAYVEVKFTSAGGINTAAKIETQVAPGAGQETIFGSLDDRPDDDWGDWIIGGTTYPADPAIEVDEADEVAVSAAALLEGQRVVANGYRSNGQTFITSVSAAQSVYLPLVVK